jgi:hypothetical protein
MIELPEEIFRHVKNEEAVQQEQEGFSYIDEIKIDDDGIKVWFEGAKYPFRGLSTPKFIVDANVVKRMFIVNVTLMTQWFMAPVAIIFLALPHKKKIQMADRLLSTFTEVAFKLIKDHVLIDKMQSPFSRELEWFIYYFMKNVGFSEPVANKFSEIMSTIIDGDNAYRLRVMDVFHEINWDRLESNPGKEIQRVMHIIKDRDLHPQVTKKFKAVALLARIIFMSPKIKKTLKETLKKVNFEHLSYDKIEKYWACLRTDYKHFGMTNEERRKLLGDDSIPVLHYK